MVDQLNPEALFLEHLGWIEKVAALACRKHGVWDAEAEDFTGWVKIRLMEDDYAALRKFRGESNLKTFLATSVVRYFHDYSRERRGGVAPVPRGRAAGAAGAGAGGARPP
jgi:DNA-directed RNA polymerase specialized sigma24 family protein